MYNISRQILIKSLKQAYDNISDEMINNVDNFDLHELKETLEDQIESLENIKFKQFNKV